jgi:hypothetical protein
VNVFAHLFLAQAVERIRRWYFEVFWYTHHLFIVFYAMLLAHGTAALLGEMNWLQFVMSAEFPSCDEEKSKICFQILFALTMIVDLETQSCATFVLCLLLVFSRFSLLCLICFTSLVLDA